MYLLMNKFRLFKLSIPLAVVTVFCVAWAIAAPSPDAIAIRILPNSNHLSPQDWYASQNFRGAPQALTVDGYEAIRDGRTVYAAVANVKDVDNSQTLTLNDVLYTNVFVISYNQDADHDTVDIFGQILKNWKFNNNILLPGNCNASSTMICTYGSDCMANDYCESSHDAAVRDTRRLADLNTMNRLLDNYKKKNGGLCPKLESGSYLPNTTVSTWPSWQEKLGKDLGLLLPVDPINKLGPCAANFNSKTCWDEKTKTFADPVADANFDLPNGSKAYVYMSTKDGKNCSFFVGTEAALACGGSGGSCNVGSNIFAANPFSISSSSLLSTGVNTPPVVVCGTAQGSPMDEFLGYVSAIDADGDAISDWTVSPVSPATWPSWQAVGWVWKPGQTGLVILNSSVKNTKRMEADEAGNTGVYQVRVTVSDGKATSSQLCNISAGQTLPVIQATTTFARAGNSASTTIHVFEKNRSYPISLSFTGTNGGPIINNFLHCATTSNNVGDPDGKYRCYINESIAAYQTGIYIVSVTATDTDGHQSVSTFILNITNTPPRINAVTCDNEIRALGSYSCNIGAVDDEGNAIVSYSAVLPPNLTISTAANIGTVSGIPALPAAMAMPYHLSFTATDFYGAVSLPTNFDLQINNFCGDNVFQAQNFEGAGGPLNNGAEQCDGTDGVALTPPTSANNRQYGCTTVGSNINLNGNQFFNTDRSCGLGTGSSTGSCNSAFWEYNITTPAVSKYYATVETSNNGVSPTHGPLDVFVSPVNPENTCLQNGVQHHVRVLVDGVFRDEFCANAVAPGGANIFSKVALGEMTAGNHVLRLEWDNDWTYDPDSIWGSGDEADSNIIIYTVKVDDMPCIENGTCTGTCTQFGGYCGDGTVQTVYGETCENGITDTTQRCNLLNINGIKDSDGSIFDCVTLSNNTIGAGGIDTIYLSLCDGCQIGCQAHPNRSYLGMGCYLGQASPTVAPPAASCQKGVWTCQANAMICEDVFPAPKFDYCCNGQSNLLATNNVNGPFTVVRATAADQVIPSFWGVYANVGTTFNYYTCDRVCQKVGKVCIGVGLNNPAVKSCISVVHDSGGGCNCVNPANTVNDNCKSQFSLAGGSTVSQLYMLSVGSAYNHLWGYLGTCQDCNVVPGLSSQFHVGETACYCQ